MRSLFARLQRDFAIMSTLVHALRQEKSAAPIGQEKGGQEKDGHKKGGQRKAAINSKFETPINVPVDTLLSLQLNELLKHTHQDLPCQSIAFHLFTCNEATLGSGPFQSSKKVINFNNRKKPEQVLVFESSKAQHNELLHGSVITDSIQLGIDSNLGTVGKLIIENIDKRNCQPICQILRRRIEQLIMRNIAQERAKAWFNISGLWCGISKAQQLIEHKLADFSKTRKPILIKGHQGSGKKLAALFTAVINTTVKPSFVQLSKNKSNATISASELEKGFLQAGKGTLYIKDVKALTTEAQTALTQYCEKDSWETQLIIAQQLTDAEPDALSTWLEYICQTLTLPSFQQRKSDIRFLCHQHISTVDNAPQVEFNDDIYAALIDSKLCDSVIALHQVIDRVMQNGSLDSLSVDKLPELMAENLDTQSPNKQKDLVIPLGRLYASRFSQTLNPSQEHPAILKALSYLAENYQESFSLQKIAEHAFVSPSHLSYLLKNRFGKSFKGLLIEFRIEKAQEILKEFPIRQITQVCIDVGFLDLSHFEKTFKKITGQTPRKYREQHKRKLSISNS